MKQIVVDSLLILLNITKFIKIYLLIISIDNSMFLIFNNFDFRNT